MKNTIYLITGALLFLVASCGGNNYDDTFLDGDLFESSYVVYIDNALDTTAVVTITREDNDSTMEYEVYGYSMFEIELSEAKYHVTAKTLSDSLIVDEDFEINGSSYIYNLNLTKADYILESVTYIVSENPELYTTNNSFTYNGKTYDDIDAKVIPGELLVPNSWDYNIEDEMPEEVTIYGDQNKTTKTKLYRSETFVLYLELFELFGDMDLDEEYDFEDESLDY